MTEFYPGDIVRIEFSELTGKQGVIERCGVAEDFITKEVYPFGGTKTYLINLDDVTYEHEHQAGNVGFVHSLKTGQVWIHGSLLFLTERPDNLIDLEFVAARDKWRKKYK
jgi:hypothetical protein